MASEELAFDGVVSYAQQGGGGEWIAAQLNVMAVMGFVPLFPGSPTPIS